MRFVEEEELAYVLTRYRQVPSLLAYRRSQEPASPGVRAADTPQSPSLCSQLHDVMHTAFGMGISIESEVALKLIEFIQTNLPVGRVCSDARRVLCCRFVLQGSLLVADVLRR